MYVHIRDKTRDIKRKVSRLFSGASFILHFIYQSRYVFFGSTHTRNFFSSSIWGKNFLIFLLSIAAPPKIGRLSSLICLALSHKLGPLRRILGRV